MGDNVYGRLALGMLNGLNGSSGVTINQGLVDELNKNSAFNGNLILLSDANGTPTIANSLTGEEWNQDQINNILGQNKGLFSNMNAQDWFGLGSNALSALTGLGSYLNGRKALKLAQDQFNMQRNAYLDNRNTQANLLNQSLQDRLNTRYLQNTGSTNGANEEYERRKLSMLNSI